MTSAELRLEPGVGGACWLIPYKREATLVIGYRGMVELAYRTGRIASCKANVVYEDDRFDFVEGTEEFIRHERSGETDPDRITHAYAVVCTSTGGRYIEVMFRQEIDAIRARSRAGNIQGSPWFTDFAEMARKTVLKRSLKYAPSSPDLRRAIELDDIGDAGKSQQLTVEAEVVEGGGGEAPEAQGNRCEECGRPLSFGHTPSCSIRRANDPVREEDPQ